MAGVTRNPRPLFVTALPTGYDGQEVFYQSTTAGTGGGATNTMATMGLVWHLRYRSAASGSYKWEAIGGRSIQITHSGPGLFGPSVTETAYTASGVIPLAGDYDISLASVFTPNVAAATIIGGMIAERAKTAGVSKVAFDRAGYNYHGRVKALAEAAREGGLKF